MALPTGDDSTSFLLVEAVAPKRHQKDQPYEYEIHLRNVSHKTNRNIALANLRVTQQVPSAMTIRSSDLSVQTSDGKTPNGRRNQTTMASDGGEGAQAVWTFSLLEPGESAVIKVTATGGQRGALAKYLGVHYDPLLRVQTEITEPELRLARKGPSVVENSRRIQFTYTLRNVGNEAVGNLTVKDKLPEGIKPTKTAENLPSGVRSGAGKDAITFTVDRLDGGEKKEWTIECEAEEVKSYSFEPAVVTGAEGRHAASEAVDVALKQGKLQVDAQADNAAQFTGQKLAYTITVKNTGDAPIESPQLTASLGKGALQESMQPAPANGATWKLAALEPGKTSPPISIVVRSNTPGTLESAFEASFDCDGELKKDKKTVKAEIKSLGLDVTVESSDRNVEPGQVFICLVKVANSGASPDGDIRLAVTLPEFASFDGLLDTDETAKADAKQRQVTLPRIGQIEPGEKKTWRLRVKATKEGSGVFAVQGTSKALGSPIAFESDQVASKQAAKPAKTEEAKPTVERIEPLEAPGPKKR
jgi:uncharacterized repeat protein (TIGR01451 family)